DASPAEYLRAAADIVPTHTFHPTSIAQADYHLSAIAYQMNREGAKLARAAAERLTREDGKPRFVAGAIGPTNRTASISPDVSSPGYRAARFVALGEAHAGPGHGRRDGRGRCVCSATAGGAGGGVRARRARSRGFACVLQLAN